MKVTTAITIKNIDEIGSQGIAVLLQDGFEATAYGAAEKIVGCDLGAFLKREKFTGSAGACALLPVIVDGNVINVFFIGLGKKEDDALDVETYRRALGTLIVSAQSKKIESLAFAMPDAKDFGVDAAYLAQQTSSIVEIAGYKYDDFMTVADKDKVADLAVTVSVDAANEKEAFEGFKAGQIISEAVNTDRDWVNCPPSRLTPTQLADKTEALAKKHGLKCTIFNEKKVEEIGMEGLHGVAKGSEEECRFVILEYKSAKADAQTIGFVGKGITFDSGGLSLKPAAYMETMKEDMAGAASVINSMMALAQLKPDVNIVAVAAITENMPGNGATKPGDILKFYNGKTAEIRNTDAEGRIVLADALAYVTKNYKLDAVIDLATLTGACIYAVGPFFSALLSDNKKFAAKIEESGARSGDAVWALPFTPDFKAAIKSDIADIQNVGKQSIAAGTITAAWFLREFVENDTPWVHLDIASTTFNVPNISYYRTGATGASVRLLVDLAMNWKN